MSSCDIPTLETERLWLRPLCASDVDDYAALNADPEVMLHLGGPWDRGRSWRHSLVHPDNRASVRLVERIGGRLLERIEHLGREMLCYGIDREGSAARRGGHGGGRPARTRAA